MQGLKRLMGALLGKQMIWIEMDLHTGKTRLHLQWLNRRVGTTLRTVKTVWGELIVAGRFRLFRGLPLYRYMEGNSKPYVVKDKTKAELHQVTLPPHALKTMVETRIFEQTYQDRMSIWIMMIAGGVVVTAIGVIALLARGG